jgi:hypothetical protein
VRLGPDLIRATRLTRTAASSEARPWFVVADRGGQKLVAAYQGDVLIARDGAEPLLVPQGSFATPASWPPGNTDAGGRTTGDRNTGSQSAGGSIPSGPDSGWTIFSLSPAASVAFLVSLGATAMVATIIGYSLGERSVSPSN